ncbi:MAG: cysteine--tRNA ligase [Candidatus Pacebacteria bacterium]|nr:cysteine--tRNA ligase [Candidatus Paceibacterota bacterium]
MLTLHNTLTRTNEAFTPIEAGKVGMYNCGPTVYDYVHIGNLRSYIFADTLRRVLERDGFDVNQVMNITDVGHLTSDADAGEDKMMKGLKRENLPVTIEGMRKLADIYTEAFVEDLEELNIEPPHVLPYASDHIQEQINLIELLEKNGLTYSTSDGLYFDTAKDSNYGKLGELPGSKGEKVDNQLTMETRIGRNEEKRNQRDFCLWKFNSELGWESPWGKGFPGWHIECSAMSMKYLGETFDIHTGGIDHIAIHHNNEIAQSEGATGKQFVHYWLHGAFLNINEEKIAKSAGNGITRKDLEAHGIAPLSYRYFILTAHYRSQVNFTWEAVEGAQAALERLRARLAELPDGGSINEGYKQRFGDALNDDLGTPQALAIVWEITKDTSLSDEDKKATILSFDDALGLKLGEQKSVEIPDAVRDLLEKRRVARESNDFATSDSLRADIEQQGFMVKDTEGGQKVTKK